MARYDNIYEFESDLAGEGLAVGIVMSRFNQDIGEGLLAACTAELKRLGVADSDIEIATVAGALEIPLVLQSMAQSDRYDALVALGAVIRGDTYHFEVVSNDSCRAVMDVQLDTGIPVANGILTCDNDDQALARMQQKGSDCARTAIETANLLRAIGDRPA
ncbi:6,7-dimethyl-8-ribityllumazine synthase [Propionivibrio sp.]|uniref:6,7-dimethyl-8-ribityllumazine synthase n=1 Tax=Propionivibrio sp. TaxID=2212460 RepID=UPI0025E2899E|nr:6,7-dimethyl-8-ribityllumazine synthase [Propionivibrio sp.]MBK7355633.1 6,7-dimethyl-8-ribityllumazine synthase [Propionivibrio sp.]MBK8400698.1 6,7-dimethyl-8-ribityllumazine synthase [Propionivibrio sp.]MBK8744729.1 6,7-dimethyl-8-ribityllumazine synthase [Propionivibrio sp.]MBK8893622.1 6,7-dimethyl-8-ribityllumazine synthase [Propionivibrio sp.]MBL0207731.1 6,7-dimethyl-8-ribityllumazine synthase [Propionivibrio sp.]